MNILRFFLAAISVVIFSTSLQSKPSSLSISGKLSSQNGEILTFKASDVDSKPSLISKKVFSTYFPSSETIDIGPSRKRINIRAVRIETAYDVRLSQFIEKKDGYLASIEVDVTRFAGIEKTGPGDTVGPVYEKHSYSREIKISDGRANFSLGECSKDKSVCDYFAELQIAKE